MSIEIVEKYISELTSLGTKIISIADTTGVSNPLTIKQVFIALPKKFTKTEFGIHLHSKPDDWIEKINAAHQAGCRRFDSSLGGFGGCPMASDELTGNIATENMISYLKDRGEPIIFNMEKFSEATEFSSKIF